MKLLLATAVQRICCFAISVLMIASYGFAQQPQNVKLEMTIDIDPVGNASVDYDLSMPAKPYAMLKQNFGDAFHVIRSMESNMSWLELTNVDARFEDQLQSVVSHCDATGLLRTTGPGQWSIDLGGDDGWELLDIHQEKAIFASVGDMGFGTLRAYSRINLPAGATDIRFQRGCLTYHYEPILEPGDRVSTDHQLLAQEHIISSLAKVYSTEQSELFAARNLFTNTGEQVLHNYRVRFRIDGYSSWSAWKKCNVVYPGQTVLDYFYPVMDIDKLAELNGTRHAMLETEYEYTTEAGEKIADSDAQRIQILSRNEVIYSTRSRSENLNWYESFDLTPMILTSFTNGTDPVMQQFAGRISALADGPASSLNSDDAIKFLNTMWLALQANHLSYQTSPGLTVNDHHGQHVKYARDVLRNRAGTCIDLAILWASAAESVGLKPYIAVIPGHAFPIIELPNGNKLPIESTMIGSASLEEAVKKGLENLNQAQEQGLIILVDVQDMKNNQNVRSLDLPKLSEDVLQKWGYDLNQLIDQQVQTEQQNNQEEQVHVTRKLPTQNQALLGDWKFSATYNGIQLTGVQRFSQDGSYECVMVETYTNGYRETTTEKGTFIDHGNYFEFHTNMGNYEQRYQWKQNGFIMEFEDLNVWFHFYRVN